MIVCEGIKAFRGSMVYDPPNPRGYKELKGSFIHKQFDSEGYWYDGWSSYDDRFCRDIQEEPDLAWLMDELEKRIGAIKGIVASEENKGELEEAIKSTEEWIDGVKEKIGVKR